MVVSSGAQIGLLHVLIDQQLLAGAGHGDPAGLQHVAHVRGLQGHVGVLLDEEDGDPPLVDLLNDPEDLPDHQGGQTQGGLVHHHDLGAAHEGPSHGQHLLLAAGQGAAGLPLTLPQTGKEERVEVSALERFLRVFGNNLLSTATGSFVGVRDIANLAITYLFDGTTYGRGINPISTAFKPFEELGKTVDLLARKGKKDLEIEEQHAKKRQAQQERLKKLRGKARQEYLEKIAEQEKYISSWDL